MYLLTNLKKSLGLTGAMAIVVKHKSLMCECMAPRGRGCHDNSQAASLPRNAISVSHSRTIEYLMKHLNNSSILI